MPGRSYKSKTSSVWENSVFNSYQNIKSGKGFSIFADKETSRVSQISESPIWSMHYDQELKLAQENLPSNGFEELILLTNQGKLWKFPIDNEQGRIG